MGSHAALMVTASDLPPLVVHRPSMKIIDGMHRLSAARLRNQDTVEARFFDGTADEAFVISVLANITHGMPLTRKDRKAAALRILTTYSDWSDRLVSSYAGLSHSTVAKLRKLSTGQNGQLTGRLGKDGKIHPATGTDKRTIAAEPIRGSRSTPSHGDAHGADAPSTTDRYVEQQRKSRPQESRGLAIPRGYATGTPAPATSHTNNRTLVGSAAPVSIDVRPSRALRPAVATALKRLRLNPAVRFNEDGRALVRLLSIAESNVADSYELTPTAPEHCLATIADIASALGDAWHDIARDLRRNAAC